jgi:ubiquitin-conjugating enzyme E2 Q
MTKASETVNKLLICFLDLTEYPRTHQYLIFSTSATVPPAIIEVLEVVQVSLNGCPVSDLLNTLHDALEKSLVAGSHRDPSQHQSGIDYLTDDDAMSATSEVESENEAHWDDEFFDEDQQFFGSVRKVIGISSSLGPDLRATKAAGFKVGYLGDLNGSLILSISCRISKLGISEKSMQAWDVQSSQYLVLLLRFPNGYVNANYLLETANDASLVQMHVGLCVSYKPSMTEALQAFARTSTTPLPTPELMLESDSLGKLLPLFLEIPLGSLLNERFITILKLRHRYSLSWSGAESLFNDSQGLITVDQQNPQENYVLYRCKDEWSETVPHLVQDDHFTSANDTESLSFPLLAMQFALRHFVKCTEFCLVCHCKIDTNFEALKPYVCSKPLCLYQYMALGMGPSIEWEITRQPLVIDLLISFAYASAAAGSMEELPVGLRMMVPPIYYPGSLRSGSLHRSNQQLTIDDHEQRPTIKEGDWILIDTSSAGQYCYCRVQSTDKWPVVDILEPVTQHTSDAITPGDSESVLVKFVLLDMNFDDIERADQKQTVIVALLQSLPDVLSMKSWLESGPPGSRSLAAWKNVPPAALDLLRWVVASNRSCIMQDGDIAGPGEGTSRHNLVTGMNGYLQFRFAQGSPDKEEKFVSAVSDNSSKHDSKYPTIFAWHGSSLSNWHGIIREGLHFKKTTNGRACGHGVYMAQQFSYSLSYSGRNGFSGIPGMRTCSNWPKSVLNVNVAVSLNEVVNRPSDFVHNSNGVYVVNRIEWIQTRYLFVDCQKPAANLNSQPTTPVEVTVPGDAAYYAQDPKYTAHGSDMKQIKIPLTIFSRRRRNLTEGNHAQKEESKTKGKSKKWKGKAKSRKRKIGTPEVLPRDDYEYDDDDVASVATLAEDLAALFSDAESEGGSETEKAIKKLKASSSMTEKATTKAKNEAVTPFEPGTLTESSITILESPAYASSSATKALQQRLLQALKVQDKTPPDELGWYIDPQLINNPYQWIVELHSFELSHPLGQDLQKAGLQSIILEMRFPQDFPMSPPFVRIIRPRLLEFNAGGGGHVTMGGALCMELLTGSGWLPTFSIENVLLSIRLALCSMDPKPARLAASGRFGSSARSGDYSVQEAVDAYTRACRAHGWEVPKNFGAMAW